MLAVSGVLLATVGGGTLALALFRADRDLSVGSVRLGVDLAHEGALDLYVPLVDWGVRFPGVRLPARLTVDVRAIDRDAAQRIATGGELPVRDLRDEATDAITSYLEELVVLVLLAGLALGGLTALALRSREAAPLPRLLLTALAGAVGSAAAVAFLLPPRGDLDDPEYYARGPDIPVALRALQDAGTSAGRLSEELDGQLVGLARLVQDPAGRPATDGLPRLVVASDLHNNVLALPTLQRAARGAPVFFTGDLTDRGSPLEAAVVRRIVRLGRPFVFVSGNHDSDVLERRLRRAGAIVLARDARPVRVAGLRVAGYPSPNRRSAQRSYRDEGSAIDAEDKDAFTSWLLERIEDVDVVLVHEPELAAPALRLLRADQTLGPKLLLAGHTHRAGVDAGDGRIVQVNGGTLGAGGTGNLGEGQPLGLATVLFRRDPLEWVAADTVEIDPSSGSANAERTGLSGRASP